jgi:Xaa-Pro aminopeptidase
MNYPERTRRLFSILDEAGADGALVTGPTNTYYLTGVEACDGFVLAAGGALVLKLPADSKTPAGNLPPENAAVRVERFEGSLPEALADDVLARKLERPGFDPETLGEEATLAFKARLPEGATLVSMETQLSRMRAIKEPEEVERIAKAVAIGDRAFHEILKFIKPGVNEMEIGAEIHRMLFEGGATGMAYGIMVAAGPRSWVAHAHPIDNVVKFGDIIKFDFGCRYRNYCADLSRTIFVGKADPVLEKGVRAVQQAQREAIAAAIDGAAVRDVDGTARAVIAGYGFPETNTFSIGHGIGIDIHEYPTVSFKRDYRLQEGMVLSIEPGLYLEGLGGIRFEDEFVVGKTAPTMITHARNDLIIL